MRASVLIPPPTFVYRRGNGLYVNLTNRCPTACRFCIKRSWKWRFYGSDLKLQRHEPTAMEAWGAIEDSIKDQSCQEIVFCGYGECIYRLSVMVELGQKVREKFPDVRIRLNTVGLGNLIWKRDIVPDLRACLDAVSISLNTADPRQWLELHRPGKPYRNQGFAGVLEFIRHCVNAGLETTVTAIDQPDVDCNAVQEAAYSLGANFRLRPLL